MKKLFILLVFCLPVLLIGQIELNIGGGINYSTTTRDGGLFGGIGEISAAMQESEDWFYRVSINMTEQVWSNGFEINSVGQNKIRYRYLNLMPQVEWLPGRAIGFVGGIYSGLLLSERFYFVADGEWTKRESFDRNRMINPGLMIGTNFYLGAISISVHYTRGILSIKHRGEFDPLSSFVEPVRKNSGIQVKMGYFFSVGNGDE